MMSTNSDPDDEIDFETQATTIDPVRAAASTFPLASKRLADLAAKGFKIQPAQLQPVVHVPPAAPAAPELPSPAPVVAGAAASQVEISEPTLLGVVPRAVRATAKSGWVSSGSGGEDAAPRRARTASIEVSPSLFEAPAAARPPAEVIEPAAEPTEIVAAFPAPPVPDEAPARRGGGRRGRRGGARRNPRPPTVTTAAAAPATAETDAPIEKWSAFQRYTPPSAGARREARTPTSPLARRSSRIAVFALLGVVAAVLVAYIGTRAFYALSTSWIAPVVISETDEQVVALRASLAAQEAERTKLAAELDALDRSIAAQQDFQAEFSQLIKTDARNRAAAIERVRSFARAADTSRALTDRGLGDQAKLPTGKFQDAQRAAAGQPLAARATELGARTTQLAAETRALDALLADATAAALSSELVAMKRDYDRSKTELDKALAARTALHAALVHQDDVVAGLTGSAHLRALADHATVALVPYDNLSRARPGLAIYACRMHMVLCHEVGTVRAVLPGEIAFKHPEREAQLRGQMVEITLTEAAAADRGLLFLGGAPLLF